MPTPPVRVMVVDDHEVVRRGVVDVCDADPLLQVVAEAAGVAEGLRRGAAVRPDVALVDLHLPDGTGIDLMRGLVQVSPGTRFVVLTSFDDDDYAAEALAVGASAFVLKTVRGAQIAETVLSVAAGRVLLDQRVLERRRAQTDDPLSVLTPTERLVLECIGDGLSNRESGERLGVSEKTVKNHVTAVMAKLGFKRRTQAAAWVASHARRS
ncbi:response regulator [Aquipuribacter sp. MA13-6]|uniref:response regulator n=1 Tax=unclassified Aquipuribacter TaxID=2635084 RepID=UPI003EEE6BC2